MLYDQIKAIYPFLKDSDFLPDTGTIHLRNDGDGKGDYIKSWTNENPRPTDEQLRNTNK